MFRLLRLITLAAIAFVVAMWISNRADAGVGIDRIMVTDPVSGREAPTVIWYPTDAPDERQTIGPYTFEAARGAEPNGWADGLIMISHGSGGGSLGHVSTAIALAKAGFVVAAPKHPGDSFGDWSQPGTWQVFAGRPQTISAVIDALMGDSRFQLAGRKIGGLGLSMGGYTMLALAGAVPDLNLLARFCETNGDDPYCRLGAAYPSRNQRDKPLDGLHDPRIEAVVLMSPATALFAEDGFVQIDIPGRFYVAGQDGIVHPDLHAERFRDSWPEDFAYIREEDAGHASFATPLPERVSRLMPSSLRDPKGFDRAGFHARINREVVEFFNQTLR